MKKITLTICLMAIVLFFAGCNRTNPDKATVSGQYPPDTQLTFKAMPAGMPKPAYLDSIIDPTYGTTITCISDEFVFGPTTDGEKDWWAPYRRHSWHKKQPWNADGTKIFMGLTEPTTYLVDGTTYSFIKRYDRANPQNNPPTEAVWSNIDPDIMYGISAKGKGGNSLVKFDVSTSVTTTLHTFDSYDYISLGLYEGNISIDDKYVALWCPQGSKGFTVVYDMKNDSVISTFDMEAYGVNDYKTGVNWLSMSQTGNYVVILWQRAGKERFMGLELFDNKMNFIRQIYDVVANGSIIELGIDAEGNDVAVYQDQSNMDIMTSRLSDGLITKVLSGSKVSKATAISCRNTKRPGWAYLSDFEAGDEALNTGWSTGKSDTAKASYNTVFALKLDGSETVEIFGHEHHSHNGGLYCQPMAVPDPTGRKVMFASDWENSDFSATYVGGPFKTARIYDYVAEYLAPSDSSKKKK